MWIDGERRDTPNYWCLWFCISWTGSCGHGWRLSGYERVGIDLFITLRMSSLSIKKKTFPIVEKFASFWFYYLICGYCLPTKKYIIKIIRFHLANNVWEQIDKFKYILIFIYWIVCKDIVYNVGFLNIHILFFFFEQILNMKIC